ncbi:Octanoate-[acyl-carrier-protein]-protein-N-octanoyltransferase [hydrothermal vent metagenome]|uniref:lipoyl(octanoyl) transferase n=1 Tax=hydrothermal vent metagenome TaxID=652676 RepID=A0A3B1B8T9_9ZZZZ
MTLSTFPLIVRNLGRQNYETVWRAMQSFTRKRTADSPDELWLVEHPAIFTLGLNGKREHLLEPGSIPVIDVDRGGQVTYHGPGQLLLYPLLDLQRHQLGVRQLVSLLEQLVIDLLANYQLTAQNRTDAPGVYVGEAKIAALGLRIKHGCSYHGMALNINMDLEPFNRINPCGYENMPVTQCVDLGIQADMKTIGRQLQQQFSEKLGFKLSTTGIILPA